MTDDLDAALAHVFGTDEPAQESKRRGKAEGKMTVRPDDGRRKRATGRTVQFNVMMKPSVKAAINKAAHRAGIPVTLWIELAALSYIGGNQ